MSSICRLLSTIESIPNQNITNGCSVIIGRNRECRIRDIKCPRNYCTISFDANHVNVKYNKTGLTQTLSNGDFLSGPAFQYKIIIINKDINTNNELNSESNYNNNNNNSINSIDKEMTDDESNENTYKKLVKPLISDSTMNITEWKISCLGRVHICRFLGGGKNSKSIAAFDFDGTLVTPKAANKFPIDRNDWKLIDNLLPKKIENCIENGYRFVVISNQLGISQQRINLDDIKHRFESALTAIGFPCLVLIAAFDDIYRKPRPGLWQLLNNESSDTPIDTSKSFYVGDAAGRKKQLNGKSDHSSADLLFAANNSLPFLTPEGFINGLKPKTWDTSKKTYSSYNITTFVPNRSDKTFIATKVGSDQKFNNINELLDNYLGKLHVIVFCGLPASGKSSFHLNYLQNMGYSYVSRDQLKTIEKCQKRAEKFLEKKQNFVIDNINVDKSSRQRWIALCRQFSAIPILFHFDFSVDHSLHNNKFRRITGINSPVTDLVIRTQNKNSVKPTADEGFESIYKINFVPKFHNKDNEKLYYMYLSEK